jgi:hypothetical protein
MVGSAKSTYSLGTYVALFPVDNQLKLPALSPAIIPPIKLIINVG